MTEALQLGNSYICRQLESPRLPKNPLESSETHGQIGETQGQTRSWKVEIQMIRQRNCFIDLHTRTVHDQVRMPYKIEMRRTDNPQSGKLEDTHNATGVNISALCCR